MRIDDSWPDYWDAIADETERVGSSAASYLAHDHAHVVRWFERHWDILETLSDDPRLDHVRFATFDGDQLTYRFRVIAIAAGGTIRLVEFALLG